MLSGWRGSLECAARRASPGVSPQGVCHSRLVLEEPASIVQLDYSQKVLLVSTAQRSLLFHTEEKSVRQIGAQPRKR